MLTPTPKEQNQLISNNKTTVLISLAGSLETGGEERWVLYSRIQNTRDISIMEADDGFWLNPKNVLITFIW